MDKKKTIIIAIVVVAVIVIVFGLAKLLKGGSNNPNPIIDIKGNEYVGYYGVELNMPDEDGGKYTENLYLRKDGTFMLDINSYGVAFHPTAGTYVINDKVITLTETVRYGSDNCYFKDQLSTYKVEVKDDNTLTLNLNDRIVDFTKNVGKEETEEYKKNYVANPTDGTYKACQN